MFQDSVPAGSYNDPFLSSVCVCVKRLNRRKTSLAAYFVNILLWQGIGDRRRHLPGTRVNVPAGLWWCTWAHLSGSWWPP